MATDDEIIEEARERLLSGVSKEQIADRSVEYQNPKDTIEALSILQSKTISTSPFIRCGNRTRIV